MPAMVAGACWYSSGRRHRQVGAAPDVGGVVDAAAVHGPVELELRARDDVIDDAHAPPRQRDG
jgi:hypothetical protein